ncbi:hypothetical protein HDU76_012501, partial [Blyttiomyces sp. JEL0837]
MSNNNDLKYNPPSASGSSLPYSSASSSSNNNNNNSSSSSYDNSINAPNMPSLHEQIDLISIPVSRTTGLDTANRLPEILNLLNQKRAELEEKQRRNMEERKAIDDKLRMLMGSVGGSASMNAADGLDWESNLGSGLWVDSPVTAHEPAGPPPMGSSTMSSDSFTDLIASVLGGGGG